MGKQKIIIVGGVAGGATAAARLRRLDEQAEIILFEKGEYISFANCGLPYYIGEVIKDKEALLVQTPEKMGQRFNLDIRIHSEVTKIEPAEKKVTVYDSQRKKHYEEVYDKLILAPGAEPVKPNLPGINSKKIFTLRNVPDTYRIKDYVDNQKPEHAVIVGAGFIGLEVAENLHHLGVKVSIVELADHVIGPLDLEMATLVHQHLQAKNIKLYLQDGVKSFTENQSHLEVDLQSGKRLKADLVIMGIGVKPETKLAKEAGLQLGQTGGILVNEYLETSDPHIYAVGDAIEVTEFISRQPRLMPLAGPANKQGRIAANNVYGKKEQYHGVLGTAIAKIFDLTVALVGNNEPNLIQRQIPYEKSFTHSGSHAAYYPGALPLSIKLLFHRENGSILGAQIVGFAGVDKRIDVLATALQAKMSVFDLEKLELAYAPPFSSAKDPINIAGYTAANILKEDARIFHWNEVTELNPEKDLLIDVRTPEEFALGSIARAINIPIDDLRERTSEISKDKNIHLFCQVGLRGYTAYRILAQQGFTNIKNLSGGYKTYQTATSTYAPEAAFDYDDSGEPTQKSLQNNHPQAKKSNLKPSFELNACGLQCPGPILKLGEAIKTLNPGEILLIKATDPGFQADIHSWCDRTGHKLLQLTYENSIFTAYIEKGSPQVLQPGNTGNSCRNDKSLIVFSNDLDKAIASFIIANGAAALGRKVTMFFTFWGLNILRRPDAPKVRKDWLSSVFGWMMPRGSIALSLSKLNFAGIGPQLIRYLMNKKQVASLEELIVTAQKNGVTLVACNMSMDLLGIQPEELIDGVTLGGVASFLGAAETSDTNLFI